MLPYANQETAIYTHDRNLMVVAGAGSGKTYVLVNRYLALLEHNRGWPLNALVAITFTRKAAQEMRDRVRQELEKRYHAAQDDFDRESWAGRIASMDSARIDTIHGLCASILRANPAEAGVDPRFEVLDEVQASRLLDDTVDAVLHAVVQENDPAVDLFTEYDAFAIARTLKASVDTDIGELPRDVLATWQTMRDLNQADQVRRVVGGQRIRNLLNWEPPGGWPPGNDKLLGIWADFRAFLRSLTDADTLETSLRIMKDLLDLNETGGGYHKFWSDHGTSLGEVRAPIKAFKAEINLIFEGLTGVDEQAARLIPLWHRLIVRVQNDYRAAKNRDAYVDFADLERLTRELLRRHPQVRARYQNAEFKHLLVDEFQDTNVDQWDIVRALADPARPGSLFIVGDGKQSIYQFRGADVSVFNRARIEIQAVGGGTVPLVRSFRTHRPLVNGFNHLFRQLLTRDPDSLAVDYEIALEDLMEAERQMPPADVPTLEVLLVNQEVYKGADGASDQCRRWEAYEIASRVCQMIDEGRPIYDKQLRTTRPMGYGDVALLFRAMSDVNLYEDVFKAVGMPFVTVSGRGYYNRQEVWDVINVLTALHNPADDLRLAAALRSPLFNLSDDALLALRILKDENNERLPLWIALDNPVGVPDDELALVQFARDCLNELRGMAGRVTISELLREILARTGYLATLTSLPDGARRRGNVEKLLDKAETSGQVTLGAFSQYLRDMSAAEVHEGEALVDVKDAVTIMTIHGSKGLEFPLVVLVDMARRSGNDITPNVLFSTQFGLTCKVRSPEKDQMVGCYAHRQAEMLLKLRDEAERKRLLYVAATRAQDYLIVSGQASPDGIDPDTNETLWKSANWLQTLLDSFDNFQTSGFAAVLGSSVHTYEGWGQVRVHIPVTPPDDAHLYDTNATRVTLWDEHRVQSGRPLSAAAEEPALLRPVYVNQASIARHLTATQIADLGGAQFDDRYRDKFRRSILHAAPTPVEEVSVRKHEVSGRIIGEMVHEALGWWRFPSEYDDLDDVLKSYAWGLGVVDDGQQKYAIQEARKLLLRTMESDVYGWIEEARQGGQVFRELPFVFRGDSRTVHGILDVLFQRPDGSWVIVDYKTSYVAHSRAINLETLRHHAQRFHLQVGVYATAVKEQLGGITPDVYIHYIRYGQTVPVYAGEWELALGKLESYIGNLLDESDWVT